MKKPLGVVLAAGLGAGLAGCGGGSHPNRSASATTAAQPRTGSETMPTAPPGGSGTASRCTSQNVAVGIHGTPSSASQYQLSVVVTDTGRSPCVLSGFPGFELSGEGKTYDPVRQGVPYSSVTVASGQQAHATFTALPGPDSCDAGTAWVPSRVLVTLPGGTHPLSSSWPGGSVDDCQGGATHPGTFIAPFLPGS